MPAGCRGKNASWPEGGTTVRVKASLCGTLQLLLARRHYVCHRRRRHVCSEHQGHIAASGSCRGPVDNRRLGCSAELLTQENRTTSWVRHRQSSKQQTGE